MLQDRGSCDKNLPWVKIGLRCLETILEVHASTTGRQPPQILSVERMIQGAIRAFHLDAASRENAPRPTDYSEERQPFAQDATNVIPAPHTAQTRGGVPTVETPLPPMTITNTGDASNGDIPWNIDFSAMDMEAFLSIDLTQDLDFGV